VTHRCGFSRRSFGQLAAVLTAGSTLPFYNESAPAQLSKVGNAPPDAVMINANENPPAKRYWRRFTRLRRTAPGICTARPTNCRRFCPNRKASSWTTRESPRVEPALHQAVLAFTSQSKALVMRIRVTKPASARPVYRVEGYQGAADQGERAQIVSRAEKR
jgi:histidinol-phosphate aminotransferase